MALTNYLVQTLICTTLFYHLGLFHSTGPWRKRRSQSDDRRRFTAQMGGTKASSCRRSKGGGYRLRWTHGADQLFGADPDLHHPVLSSRAVYAAQPE
jgi:hypothetical protein